MSIYFFLFNKINVMCFSYIYISLSIVTHACNSCQSINIQSAKILLVPPKCKIIMVLSDYPFFQYCDSNVDFIAPCIVITLNLFYFSKVIALPTIAIAIKKENWVQ